MPQHISYVGSMTMALDSVDSAALCHIPDCIDYKKAFYKDEHHHHIHRFRQVDAGSEGKNSYRVPLKLRYDLIPPIFLQELASIYEEGSIKYGDAKYIEKPLPYSVIVNH